MTPTTDAQPKGYRDEIMDRLERSPLEWDMKMVAIIRDYDALKAQLDEAVRGRDVARELFREEIDTVNARLSQQTARAERLEALVSNAILRFKLCGQPFIATDIERRLVALSSPPPTTQI